MTSGDIQYGVPTNVFFFAESVPESCPETPKSANFTSPPADSSILAAIGEMIDKKNLYEDTEHTFDISMQLPLCMQVI